MKKDFKVIQLNGPAGLILALIAVLTVLACITILPVYGIKFLWNAYLNEYFQIPAIRLSQASLLWGACLAVMYGNLKKKFCFKVVNGGTFPPDSLTKVDYEKFMEQIQKEQEENEKINH